jgi:hypothetical protein
MGEGGEKLRGKGRWEKGGRERERERERIKYKQVYDSLMETCQTMSKLIAVDV